MRGASKKSDRKNAAINDRTALPRKAVSCKKKLYEI